MREPTPCWQLKPTEAQRCLASWRYSFLPQQLESS